MIEFDRELGRLDIYSKHLPNIDLFLCMHVTKEAIQSIKIEGTQRTMYEALLDKDYKLLNKRDSWETVQNYIKSI